MGHPRHGRHDRSIMATPHAHATVTACAIAFSLLLAASGHVVVGLCFKPGGPLNRRKWLLATTPSMTALVPPSAAAANANAAAAAAAASEVSSTHPVDKPHAQTITIPLTWTGEEYLIYYRINGLLFRAVVDTGSPFLTVPGSPSCGNDKALATSKWGCYRPDMAVPSGLDATYELFDGVEGEVEWRSGGPLTFVNATGSLLGPPKLIFGVLSKSLMKNPGGCFFGLVKETDSWIRPSFLSQTSVRSFALDLRTPSSATLSLSTKPMIPPGNDYIRMVDDLRARYGDPTLHYTAVIKSITVNGNPFVSSKKKKPIFAIFDSGVSQFVVCQELFDERYAAARANRERSLWGEVEISFESAEGKPITLTATKPLTTPLGESPWKVDGYLVVIGLSFLNNNKLLFDLDDKKLWIENGG